MKEFRNSRRMIRRLLRDGWYEVDQTGSHIQFKHPMKKGRVTVPHPVKDLPIKKVSSILKQAGIELEV